MVSPRLVQRLNDAQSLSSTQPQSTPTKDSSSRHHRSPLAPLQSHHLHEEQVAKSTPEAKRSLNLDSSYYDQEGEGGGHNRPGSSNSKHWEKDNDLIDTDLDDSWLEQLGSNSGGGRRRYEHGSGLFDLGFRELDGRDLDGRGTPRAQVMKLSFLIYRDRRKEPCVYLYTLVIREFESTPLVFFACLCSIPLCLRPF